MKVTVIIENKSYREDLLSQYGLSLFVETSGGSFLLDAGSDESALTNFIHMGFSPEALKIMVISHNHFDHFGGAVSFMENGNAMVYMSDAAKSDYYTKTFMCRKKIVSRTDIIDKYYDRFRLVEDQTEILPGVYVCRIKKADKNFFCKDHRLKRLSKKRLVPDDFSHEVYIAVLEEGNCKLISSCSHNGIINILEDAKTRFPNSHVVSFVGGLHMKGSNSKKMNCTRAYAEHEFSMIENSGLNEIYTGHCTGQKAFELLRKHDRIESHYFSTGDSFVL